MTFGIDELTVSIVQRACTVLYFFLTIAALGIALVVRQFVLGLPVSGHDDLAMFFTVNVLAFIGVVLYLGGVIVPRIRAGWLAAIYVAMSLDAILGHLRIVASIIAIMVAGYAGLA